MSKKAGSPEESPEAQAKKRSLSARLRTYFLTGIVVAAPISITIYLTWLFVVSVDERITSLIPAKYNPETYLPVGIPGLGVVIVVIFLTLLGMITANFFGRALLNFGERLLNNLPVVRSVYGTLKQIFETIISLSSMSFREVVMVEYPRRGLYAIAFVTATTKGEIAARSGQEMVNVFLPTTPNPTSGFLLFVPKKDLTYLDMTVEEGVKYVISAGLVTPQQRIEKAAGVDPDPQEKEVMPVQRDIDA
ncbi:MAG: DUF502 domain-containing protein [Sphingomonadales bacterium]